MSLKKTTSELSETLNCMFSDYRELLQNHNALEKLKQVDKNFYEQQLKDVYMQRDSRMEEIKTLKSRIEELTARVNELVEQNRNRT